MQKLLLILLLTIGISFHLVAQEEMVTIEGIVYDESKEPAIGAGVRVTGTNTSTYTDIDGKFRISFPAKYKTLDFFYIGYKTTSVRYGNNHFLTVTLEVDYQDLGLPSSYYIRGYFSFSGAATRLPDNDKWGYLWNVEGALPYIWSERYKMNVYDILKSYTSIGLNVAKTNPSEERYQTSLYMQASKRFSFGTRNGFRIGGSVAPFANIGLYLDAKDKTIESQNMKYGGGLKFSFYIWRFKLPYINLITGYNGYNKASEFNHYYIGLQFTPPLTPVYYY